MSPGPVGPPAGAEAARRRLPPDLAARLAGPLTAHRGVHRLERLPSGRVRETRLGCYGCDAPLKIWGPDPDEPVVQRRVSGTDTVIHEVAYATVVTAAYDTVLVEMAEADGGRSWHSLTICPGCKAALTVEQAAEMYVAVLEQLALDAEVLREPVEATTRLLAWMARRRVVGVLR